ncbi:MAG: hypothetical protein COB54_00465 [Alphaproteobacteria bacterium]|nr:MAG: hypothetical protein COB54_00465 [Alphaproteobacteria bacterium]
MTKQLYKRKSGILAVIFAVFFAAATGANAADQKSDFLNRDIIIGDENAPIEIIEYASLTCSHCATFNEEILPELMKKYVNTGKVKIVFRNFVFTRNAFDVFASSLSRCVTEKRFHPLVGLYFKRQRTWLKYQEFGELQQTKKYGKYAALGFARGEAIKIAKIAGMKESEAYQCLARTDVLKYLMDGNKEARDKYKVNATPTIIVNGKKTEDYQFETIEKAILAASK